MGGRGQCWPWDHSVLPAPAGLEQVLRPPAARILLNKENNPS